MVLLPIAGSALNIQLTSVCQQSSLISETTMMKEGFSIKERLD
jgi:uncharacterized membrane protein